ncbi:unnamed protein product, partial [Brugia timori]|uniref:Ovule protein n=1 Tax=Brugia timori TaxID=42155 RepID=A0A0R3QA21_9BILA
FFFFLKVYSIRFETIYGIGNQKLDSTEVFFTANETFKAVSLTVRSQVSCNICV